MHTVLLAGKLFLEAGARKKEGKGRIREKGLYYKTSCLVAYLNN